MPRLSRSELEGSSLVWLLRVEYAGREFLFSSLALPPGGEPVDDNGTVKGVDGLIGADLSVGEEWALMSTISSARSVSFDEVIFPVDVSALVESGHSLSGGFGELALWRVGDSYDDRRVFIYGRLTSPEYGAEGEPVSFTVEENPFDDTAIIPKSTHRASEDTWADLYEGEAGEYYPIVFGEPGIYKSVTGSASDVSGSRALGAEYDSTQLLNPMRKLLIAGHAVQASTVKVYDATSDKYEEYTPEIVFDRLGKLVTVVDISTTATITGTNTDFWIQWDGGGALPNKERTEPLAGGGDLLEWFLLQSSLRVDQGRVSSAKQFLNSFKFSGFIDSPVSPWEWVEDNLLPLLPVSIVSGSEGVFPVVWRMDATVDQAVASITAGTQGGITRDSSVSYENSPLSVINEIRIDWAYSPVDSTYQRFTVLKGTPDPDASMEVANYYANVSEARFGNRATTLQSAILYDEDTVLRVLNWKLRASGFLHRSVSYRVGKSWGWLGLGDVVSVTDSDLSLSERVGLVQSVTWETEETLLIGILLVEDPARDMI